MPDLDISTALVVCNPELLPRDLQDRDTSERSPGPPHDLGPDRLSQSINNAMVFTPYRPSDRTVDPAMELLALRGKSAQDDDTIRRQAGRISHLQTGLRRIEIEVSTAHDRLVESAEKMLELSKYRTEVAALRKHAAEQRRTIHLLQLRLHQAKTGRDLISLGDAERLPDDRPGGTG